jgi:hypothetical protein
VDGKDRCQDYENKTEKVFRQIIGGTTMKAYTDLKQSKKLAEILLIKSADMCYRIVAYNPNDTHVYQPYCFSGTLESDIPCWSLAALLEQIPSDLGSATLTIEKCDSEPFKYGLNYHDCWGREDDIQTKYYDDLVDVCYEMILKLHKLKLL